MANEMNFAETVMLVDAAYLNRVCGDLKKHFSTVLGRELPKADLPVLMECLALDAGLQFGENNIQVLLIYDKESENMSTCQPGDLRQELNTWGSSLFILLSPRIWQEGMNCFLNH